MKLSIEERKIGMKYHILTMLSDDIFDKRYIELEQIYDSLGYNDNIKLLDKLSEDRNIPLSFVENIYFDILMVISDNIMDRPETLSLFETLYEERYPHIKQIFMDIENQYKKSESNIIKKNGRYSQSEIHYFYYLVYKSDKLNDSNLSIKGVEC